MPSFTNAAMSSMSAVLRGRQYVRVQSSSVAQAACDLELWDRGSIGHHSTDSYTVAGASFASCSRVSVSLRRRFRCVVRSNRAGIARDYPLRFRFLPLLPVARAFVEDKP